MLRLFLTAAAITAIVIPASGFGLELPSDPAEAGKAIYVHQDNLDKGFKDQEYDVEMVLLNKAGQESTREFNMKVLEVDGDGDKSVIVFKKPLDIRDTALLTFEHVDSDDDQWLYLPTMKRVKRIASRNKSGSFVGSEVSYEDLSSNKPEKFTFKYTGEDTLNGEKVWVVERYPKDEYSGYTKQITRVSQANYQTLQIEFYDRKNALLKTMDFLDYREYAKNIWRYHKVEVHNVQTGKKTVMTSGRYTLGSGFQDSQFTQKTLERQ